MLENLDINLNKNITIPFEIKEVDYLRCKRTSPEIEYILAKLTYIQRTTIQTFKSHIYLLHTLLMEALRDRRCMHIFRER